MPQNTGKNLHLAPSLPFSEKQVEKQGRGLAGTPEACMFQLFLALLTNYSRQGSARQQSFIMTAQLFRVWVGPAAFAGGVSV